MKRIAGYFITGISGLFLISSFAVFVITLFGGGEYESLGIRIFSCIVYVIMGMGFFYSLKLGLKLSRKNKGKKKDQVAEDTEDNKTVNDDSYIGEIHCKNQGSWYLYSVQLKSKPYGWDYMKDTCEYMAKNEFSMVDKVTACFSVGGSETDLTESYRKNNSLAKMEELENEGSSISLAGNSSSLNTLMKITWYNQTNVLGFCTIFDDKEKIRQYAEKIIYRSFKTEEPVIVNRNQIDLSESGIRTWFKNNRGQYELLGEMLLEEKTPVILLSENGKVTNTYVLETAEDEDFTGMYFNYSVRINLVGKPLAPAVQIDGFIAENKDIQTAGNRVGYRFEGYHPYFGGDICKQRREMQAERDLYEKGLRYPGYTTPGTVRLVGICSNCNKSITFRSYNYYLTQGEPLYSDDGLDVISIENPEFDKNNGVVEKEGKKYRYYNSFCCKHCGQPYINYKKYPEMKKFGVAGCSYKLKLK